MEMNEGLEYWTADEVAECLSFEKHYEGGGLYEKLWGILAAAENPTPMGGDGTVGTVEEPAGRLDPNNEDKAPHWWSKLTEAEQAAINAAYAEANI